MPSSDFDHNYYTLQHPRRPSQESNHDQFPSVLDNADRKLCNPTPPSPDDQVSVIPTYSYSHPLQTPPKRPSISTDFDSYASEARLNGFTSDPPTDDNSPDPHDFYKPFRDPFTEALPGQRDIVVLGKEEGMTTSSYQRKPNPVPGRINGSSSKHAPIHPRISTRPSQYSASPTSGNSSPLNAAKSSPNLSGTARNRQTSLKDLVDKFNQTPNEKPLLPAKPGARSAASLLKPVSRPQALGRTRTPSQPALSGAGDSTNNSKSIREKPKNPSRSAQRRNYSNDGIRSPTNLTALSHTTQPNRSTIASNVGTSQFQREVSGLSPSREPFKPRLFGEILSVNTDSPDLGYGISAPRRRRGSEGSMHSPNPMFPHSRVEGDPGLSPSSPTAWYLGYTPSLDGVRTDRPGMHRRARSDFNGNTSKPVMASALGMHVATASPLPQPRGAKKSSSGSQRNSQSRIPVSTRRMSGTSDSGNSMPSSRADSALGRMSGNKSIPTGTSGLPRLRKKSISPIRTSRESTIRSSPRRQNHSPPPHHLRTSPLLKAYISAPLPKKSPPLRSSRPRQPVSSASTSASRAKAVDRPGLAKDAPSRDWKEPKHRKLPELGGVDFAARRQKIQQAIAKTVQEGEKKDQMRAEQRRITRRKADEERQAREEDQASEARKPYEKAHSEEAAVKESFEPDVEKAIGQDRTEPSDGAITLNDRHLTLDTTNLSRSFSHIDLAKANSSDNADSPTLGIPGSFSGLHPTVDRSHTPGSDRAPSSAMTAGTADTEDTVIDNEPQIDSTELDPRHRTILSQVMRMRASSPASPSRSVADDSVSDKDDRESIQIMLRATPVVDGPANSDEDEPQEEKIRDVFSNEGPCDRWSMDSWTSSVLDRQSQEIVRDAPNQLIDEPTPLQPEASAHSSFSTTAGSETPQHWSPAELSTPRTARKTLDSEAYSTINRILEHYHDPSLVSPQMMQDFQQQLLIQSPELARQGGWDPKRVTQLYLQELARGRLTSGSAVPGPLNIGLRRPFQPPLAPSHARTDIGKTEYEGSEVCGQDAEHGQEHTECADSSNRASLDVEPAELNPQRASLNHPDDWAHTSPSILDWIHPQARDSPVDERRESDYRPAPPPKERRSSPPRVDLSETIRTYQDESLLRREPLQTQPLLVDGGPRLPEIFGPGELGLAIRIDSPRDSSSPVLAPIPPLPDYSPPLPPIVPPIGEVLAASGASIQSPPSPSTYSKHNLSFQTISSENIAPKSSTRSSGASSQQHDLPTSSVQTSNSSSRSQERCELGPRSPSPESANKTPVTPEQKRLFKRWNVVKEIVDSEYSYRTDMLILDDIYRATAAPSGGLSAEDIRLLFGNLDQIMALSTELLDALKQAATSIYVIPKSSRWRAKRGSSSTSNTGNTDDQASMSGGDSLDDEKDRMTFIGEVFAHYMEDIEKVYAEYLRNHDAANKKLLSLQGTLLPDAWLKSCKEWSRDLTAAWDLDSLIVKPVQRVLKYPLLLTQLLEVTPENHPDYTALDIAVREIMGASHRINEMKKRADLVEQVVSSRKRKESDVRTGLSKAFGRRTEKLRQQVGLSELYEDKEYNILCEKLNYNFLRLQLVMRDFDSYTSDVQLFMDKFNEFVGAIEGFIDVGPTTHPELESKWRKFRMSMREVSATALTDHMTAIRKSVIEPMISLIKLHDGPQRVIQKRNKRLPDYARFKAVKSRGEKPDKKTHEQGEQFVALNDTLKEELPKFFSLSRRLVGASLGSFLHLQVQWYTIWRKKLSSVLDSYSMPKHLSQIIDQFSSDFAYAEASVLTLGICNGSMLADAVNLVGLLSPSSTLLGDDQSGSSRSKNLRHRGLSLNSDVSPSLPQPDFGLRHSGSFTFSPLAEYAPQLPTGSRHTSNQLSSNGRMRAGSGVSSRDPATPDMSGGNRSIHSTTPGGSNVPRPATGQGRNTDPSPTLPRLSVETLTFNLLGSDSPEVSRTGSGSTYFSGSQDTRARAPSPPGRYASSFFSSALPMSDSPRPQTPADRNVPPEYNVMFLVASVVEFNLDRKRVQAGYPYLEYGPGEIFDVLGEVGETWLAKNQDDPTNQIGWLWKQHFVKLSL